MWLFFFNALLIEQFSTPKKTGEPGVTEAKVRARKIALPDSGIEDVDLPCQSASMRHRQRGKPFG